MSLKRAHTESLTTIHSPDGTGIIPSGIKAAGQIVGAYIGSNDDKLYGFLLDHGTFQN
jgi:hypothetical protein